jgi:hypothetical protein
MQTPIQIEKQIRQIESEIRDVISALSRIEDTQNLIAAHGELRNRQEALALLRSRLELSRERERNEQTERERLELETGRDTAKDEIERLNNEFDSLLAPLEAQLDSVLPKLFELARARQSQQSRYSELARKLRGGPDELGLDILVGNYGFTVKDEADPTKLRRLLLVLYRDFIGVAGGFKSLTQPMPMLGMTQASLPTPHKHTDTLDEHLQTLGF